MVARLMSLWPVPFALSLPLPSRAQTPTPPCSEPAQVVQSQDEAFNKHDLDAFVASYSPNIQISFLPADTVAIADTAALRRKYTFLRDAPSGFGVDITERIVTGCFVIDHERLRPVNGRPARDAGVAIYQIAGRLIRRVWFAGP